MTDNEMKLDMLVAELDYENRLLRARNERLEIENQELKKIIEARDNSDQKSSKTLHTHG
jgi:hypothetical protein